MAASPHLPAAVLVQPDGSFRACTWEEVAGGLVAPEGGLLWILPDPAEPLQATWLSARAGVDPVARRALAAAEGRPGVHPFDEALLVTLRGVNLNQGMAPEDMVTLRMWLEPSRVIVVRHHRVRALEDVLRSFESDGAPRDASDLLLRIVNGLLGRISRFVEALEDEVDALEDRFLDEGDDPERGELADLRRRVMLARRHLVPERDALIRMHHEKLPVLLHAHLRSYRDAAGRMTRYADDLEVQRERAILMHEELVARESERMNTRMYLFTVIAGVFLPLTFLTGLLGINVGGIPGSDNPGAFLLVSGICAALGVGSFLLLRFSRWL